MTYVDPCVHDRDLIQEEYCIDMKLNQEMKDAEGTLLSRRSSMFGHFGRQLLNFLGIRPEI